MKRNAPIPEEAAEETGATDRNFVTALARGLDVLRVFGPARLALSNQEIADAAHLPRPTVARLTYTLQTIGFLAYDGAIRKYRLAPAAISIGYTAMASSAVRLVAQPLMQEMADEVGFSVALGVRDRLSMIYIAHCSSRAAMVVQLVEGSRLAIATSAMGRAYAAAMDAPQRSALLAELRKSVGAGDWPRVKTGLEKGFDDYAKVGFTTSHQEWHVDVSGVSVPFVAKDGTGVYAFNCGGPAILSSQKRLQKELGPRLVRLVREVDRQLHDAPAEPLAASGRSLGKASR